MIGIRLGYPIAAGRGTSAAALFMQSAQGASQPYSDAAIPADFFGAT